MTKQKLGFVLLVVWFLTSCAQVLQTNPAPMQAYRLDGGNCQDTFAHPHSESHVHGIAYFQSNANAYSDNHTHKYDYICA